MFYQVLIAVLIGICFGIITGLIPGIHVNLISIILFSLSPLFLEFTSPITLAIVIISMAVTHTFLDTIPSVFLGAPDSDNILSVLPGHRLLLKGRGYEAVMLTVVGSLGALVISASLIPFIIPIVKFIYPYLKIYIGYLILATVIFLIWKERRSKLTALSVFLLSGVLGLGVLNMQGLQEPLFPLLSGLFGTSMLLLSVKDNTKIPEQKITSIEIENGGKALGCSVVSGWVCSFMPGLGPSQAAILGSTFVKNLGNKGFLILVGGLSTVNMALSFVTLYVLDKARNGAVVTVSKILTEMNFNYFLLFIGAALVVGGVATILASKLSKVFAKVMSKVNYKALCLSIVGLIIVLVGLISGWLGLFVLTIATFVGMIPVLKGIGRNHMMGCLLIPVMMYFLL